MSFIRSSIAHLGGVLHPTWSKKKYMLMLTSYMDETGHPDDPRLHFCGMAGFCAPLAKWQEFEKHWQPTLDSYGLLEPFHMKDFAHSAGEFIEWKGNETKRRELYGKLMKIIRDTEAEPIGAIVSLEDFHTLTDRQQHLFHSPYMTAFQTCTHGIALQGLFTPEKVAMVYSYNQEFGATQTVPYRLEQAGTAEQLWHHIKESTDYGKHMGAYASSTPRETVQLQSADIFAYELSKDFENQIQKPELSMRWGLKQILKMSGIPLPMVQLFRRKQLLNVIKLNGWPEKDGIEELSDLETEEMATLEERIRWTKERGKWDEPLDEI
jgi:hypothetical protein